MRGLSRWFKLIGWSLIVLSLTALGVGIVLKGLLSVGEQFNRTVGWANIWAVPVSVLGLVLVIVEKKFARTDAGEERHAADRRLLARHLDQRLLVHPHRPNWDDRNYVNLQVRLSADRAVVPNPLLRWFGFWTPPRTGASFR